MNIYILCELKPFKLFSRKKGGKEGKRKEIVCDLKTF